MTTKKSRRLLPRTKGGRAFAVMVILVIAALVAYFVHGAVAKDDTDEVTYTTGAAETMTLTSSVSGEGNIEWVHASDVTSSLSGTVSDLQVSLGQKVDEDQKLFVVAGSRSSKWVTAPIAGRITALNVANGDEIDGSSSSTPAATIIDLNDFKAVVTIAESDIASVMIGQKAVITFDALPDLTLTGMVTSMDFTGTNTSGVVSYRVVITPDTPNVDVRGGMTVSVNIITDVAADVLAVPSSAVKTSTNGSYVQILGEDGQLTDVTVETGMTTDSYVQILSGLTEGQEIVVSSSKSSSTTATTTYQRGQGSLLDGGGLPGGGFAPPGQ